MANIVEGKRHDSLLSIRINGKDGDWFIDERCTPRVIYLRIPGDDSLSRWELAPDGIAESERPRPSWRWDGNHDAPTLTPSLHLVGVWHGWMKEGRLESV